MKQLTYFEARDKIIQAYFKNDIAPFNPHFCFCGTLCNGRGWYDGVKYPKVVIHNAYSGYTGLQLGLMEKALLDKVWKLWDGHAEWEDALFAGMSDALDVLKEIHRERGENVDEVPTLFKKRELVVK